MSKRIGWANVLAFVVVLSGCGTGTQGQLTADQMDEVKLREVGELYRLHQVKLKKAPRSLKDFNVIGEASIHSAMGRYAEATSSSAGRRRSPTPTSNRHRPRRTRFSPT